MSAMKVYNSDELNILVGPVLVNNGLANGDVIRVESSSDIIDYEVGCDGEVAISRTNDHTASIYIMVMSTSAANDGLSILANLAKTAPKMAGAIVPIEISDRNGRSTYKGANCVVSKEPNRVFGKKANTNEWKIFVAQLVRVDGGN